MPRIGLLGLLVLLLAPAAGAKTDAGAYLPIAMRFFDRQHGYVELAPVVRCSSCRNRVVSTDNGGRTWSKTRLTSLPFSPTERRFRQQWATGSRRHLQLAAVVSSTVAWATSQSQVGERSRLFVTRDGGQTWHRLLFPCGNPYSFYRPLVGALSARRTWLLCLGQPGAGQQNKALYETADTVSWKLRRNLSGSGYGVELAFAGSGFGLLSESRGGLLVTRNDGSSWGRAHITVPEVAEPIGIAVFAPRSGLALVQDDRGRRHIQLYGTENAGRSWHLRHVWRWR